MQINNHTQISNYFIDNYMSQVSGSATKVFLAISRKTIGWHKDIDIISYSQLKQITGIAVNSLVKGIKELLNFKVIISEKSGSGKACKISYEINYDIISNSDISKTDIIKPVIMSKIDTKKLFIMSKTDNTKDNNIKIEYKDINTVTENSTVDNYIKKQINNFYLKVYQQEDINRFIFKNAKERKQYHNLVNELRYLSELEMQSFFEKVKADKWLMDNGAVPSLLVSQFSKINMKKSVEKKEMPDFKKILNG